MLALLMEIVLFWGRIV